MSLNATDMGKLYRRTEHIESLCVSESRDVDFKKEVPHYKASYQIQNEEGPFSSEGDWRVVKQNK
ncbi:hypothetical protein ACUXCC_002814 [Cytobacillus horneckiae]|uniref:Uncharacterized protein n=1 Tax=Cytobacillus horneckiae TaxID=549687 RepID=A0A2N0ZJY4_9BACI|nr:hypothetical protein CWS20_06230 [Cytobacillus horneckiae]